MLAPSSPPVVVDNTVVNLIVLLQSLSPYIVNSPAFIFRTTVSMFSSDGAPLIVYIVLFSVVALVFSKFNSCCLYSSNETCGFIASSNPSASILVGTSEHPSGFPL